MSYIVEKIEGTRPMAHHIEKRWKLNNWLVNRRGINIHF